MINAKDKLNCCGCSACVSICPKKAISFETDREGFKYPIINKDFCIGCNLCSKVCPFLNNQLNDMIDTSNEELIDKKIEELSKVPKTYACFLKDYRARYNSTSGGFFTAVADYVIDNKGYVCGVTYDENNNICHKIINVKEDIKSLRGSKYVQSSQESIFKEIKKLLNNKKLVLYSGTPCQVEGLLRFLQKPYKNLITVDLVCHGVGSPAYWDKYKEYMESKYKSKIKKISFREKTYGYNSSCMAIEFENGKKSKKGHNGDKYLLPFFTDYILRPSCYNCKIKKLDRKSDFTMGDYWSIENLTDKFKGSNGCTLIICNTDKSNELFNNIKDNLIYEEIRLKDGLIINSGRNYSMILKSTKKPENRKNFFEELSKTESKDLERILDKYMPLTKKEKIACLVKPILYKLKILEKVKKVVK